MLQPRLTKKTRAVADFLLLLWVGLSIANRKLTIEVPSFLLSSAHASRA